MDDIEILDINDKKPVKKRVDSRVKKRKKLKKKGIQLIFCLVSFIFILGCIIFYGTRFIKYYRIYNPKAADGSKIQLMANDIISKSPIIYEGDGLYIEMGNYIYKGNVSNNYLKYNNMLWRIVRINSDKTIEIITDDYINLLEWNKDITDFSKSSINKYLNEYFLKSLNNKYLVMSSYFTDILPSLDKITSNNIVKNYVKLLSVNGFLNTLINGKTYLSHTSDDIYWLSDYATDTIWHTNGYNVSKSTSDNKYEIRPVVTLNSTNILVSGDGTIDNPYVFEKNNNKIAFGSYVKLDKDIYQVYEIDKEIKLVKNDVLDKQLSFNTTNVYDIKSSQSIGYYLNNSFLNSLSYKDLLVDTTWYIGNYKNIYSDVLDKNVVAKVGLLNMMDIKLNNEVSGYYLSTGVDGKYVYAYNTEIGKSLRKSKPTISRNIRPCIALSKDVSFTNGDGTINNPFIIRGAL